MKKIQIEAKNVQKAIEQGLKELNVTQDQVDIKIIDEGGFFRKAKVELILDKDVEEKISKLYVMQGGKAIEVKELHAGDIGAIAKLTAARTGDTLSTKANTIMYGKTDISTPYTYKRYNYGNIRMCLADL